MKTRPNDPCPCGSGKKHKRCCLSTTTGQGQVVQLKSGRHDPLSDQVWSKLQNYLQRAVAPKEIKRAYLQWSPGIEEPDGGLTPDMFHKAFDWLFLGYRTTQGGTICTRYALWGDDLTLSERKLLAKWAVSSPGFFWVDKVTAPGRVQLSRLPDGSTYTVSAMGTSVKPGMLITAWLLPTDSGYRYGHAVGAAEREIAAPLRHLLGMEMDLYQRQRPNATWDSLYRDLWPRLMEAVTVAELCRANIQYCKLPKGPSVRWDGEPLTDADERCDEVESLILNWAETGPPGLTEPEPIVRLWWDGVVALRPRVTDPRAWAASVFHAFWHRVMGHPQVTPEVLAYSLKVPTTVVADQSQQLADALKLTPSDLRYVFLLDGWFRTSWQTSLIETCNPVPLKGPAG